MARKPNYGFEKRQKELDRQKKKDEKAQARRQRAEEMRTQPESQVPLEPENPDSQ